MGEDFRVLGNCNLISLFLIFFTFYIVFIRNFARNSVNSREIEKQYNFCCALFRKFFAAVFATDSTKISLYFCVKLSEFPRLNLVWRLETEREKSEKTNEGQTFISVGSTKKEKKFRSFERVYRFSL